MRFPPLAAAISGYILTASLIYSNPFQPLFLLAFWRDRLGIPFWPLMAALGLLATGVAVAAAQRYGAKPWAINLILLFLPLTLPTLIVGTYAEFQRNQIVASFKPDELILNSIFMSLRHAPAEFQFFLHAAALKNCRPYAWSYRRMAFYELPSNVATNVLPQQWIEKCHIK